MSFSLHRRKGSPYWYAYFRVPDPSAPGKLIQRPKSTKKENKEEAKKVAREFEEAALREAGAGDAKSREIYQLLKSAADLAAKGHLNEARGREFLSEMIRVSTGRGLRTYTVKEWFSAWLADKAKANAEGTHLRYQGVVKQFLAFLPVERVQGNLMNLTPEDIRDFRDFEHASGKSPGTVNDAVKTIRTALNKARKQQVIANNPADAVEMLVADDLEKAVFSSRDIDKLLAAAEGDWKGVILFGYYSGASLRDITDLRWEQIDLLKGVMVYRRRKTGQLATVPLHQELRDWILKTPSSEDPKAPLFPSLAGRSTAGKSGLSMQFGRIMKKARIAGEVVKPAEIGGGIKTKGRSRNTLSFHSLRHSFNSALANAGVPIEIRQKLTAHASAKMNEHYTHLELKTLEAAVAKVPRLRKT